MRTLNEIIEQITVLATAHAQIASSGVGTIAELQASERDYPLLWVFYESSPVDDRYLVNQIRIIVADRVIVGEEGDENTGQELEVLSDSLSILVDFLAYFMQQHTEEYVVDRITALDPFTEDWNDRVAGHSLVIQIKQFFDWNKCQIPETGAAIPPSVDGLTLYDFCDAAVRARLTSAQVTCLSSALCTAATTQVNATNVGTVAPGGTWDQEIHDTAGADVGTDANPSVIADATVVNNAAGTFTQNILAEGVHVLDQGKMLDSDGLTTVLADYLPASDGFMFTASPGTSVSVSSSDDTPNFKDTITLTATSSGITPTNYIFIADNGTNLVEIADSANAVVTWEVDIAGTVRVLCIAKDGSAEVGSEVILTCNDLSTDTRSALFIYAHNTLTGLTMGSVARGGIDIFIDRLNGIGTANGTVFLDDFISSDVKVFPYCPIDDATANANAFSPCLIDPSDTLTFNNFVAGDFTPDGLIGGATKEALTDRSLDDYLNRNTGFHAYSITDASAGGRQSFGNGSGGNLEFWPRNSTTVYGKLNHNTYTSGAQADSLGLLSVAVYDGGNIEVRKRGVLQYSGSVPSKPTNSQEIRLHSGGSVNYDGSARYATFIIGYVPPDQNAWDDIVQAVDDYNAAVITGGRDV